MARHSCHLKRPFDNLVDCVLPVLDRYDSPPPETSHQILFGSVAESGSVPQSRQAFVTTTESEFTPSSSGASSATEDPESQEVLDIGPSDLAFWFTSQVL